MLRSPAHRRAFPRLLGAGLLAVAFAWAGAPAAHASAPWRAPCLGGTSGPECTWWDARATFIADGDTITAKIDEGAGKVSREVRFTGINAMELHRYSKYARRRRGECHGVAATAVVEQAIRASHWHVRLAAQRASSHSGRRRIRRSVWADVDGSWKDVSRLELERGLALWLPNGIEWAHNSDYRQLAEEAAQAKRGLYNPKSCGAGPEQGIPISLLVNWDADGTDSANINGEWVDVVNGGRRPLRLDGWWFRDSWLNWSRGHRVPGYPFPRGTSVPAGGRIRLHIGCGHNRPRALYWCQHSTAFENVTLGSTAMGDGGYLFDPQGDLRASSIYPCVVACDDALNGNVEISVHPTAPEHIDILNVSSAPVDLGDHVLKLGVRGSLERAVFGHWFPRGTVVGTNEAMHVYLDRKPRSRGGGKGGRRRTTRALTGPAPTPAASWTSAIAGTSASPEPGETHALAVASPTPTPTPDPCAIPSPSPSPTASPDPAPPPPPPPGCPYPSPSPYPSPYPYPPPSPYPYPYPAPYPPVPPPPYDPGPIVPEPVDPGPSIPTDTARIAGPVRALGRGSYVLSDRGGVVTLQSPTAIVVACGAWGYDRCSGGPSTARSDLRRPDPRSRPPLP